MTFKPSPLTTIIGWIAAISVLSLVPIKTVNANIPIQEYDYIVVGAGSAGSIVASQLANQGNDVLVIEAGGDEYDPAIENMRQYFNVAFNTPDFGYLTWPYRSTEQQPFGSTNNLTFALPRGRLLGGSHSINAAAFTTGHRDDFDMLAATLNDDDWNWQSIVKFVKRLQRKLDIVRFDENNQIGGQEYVESAERVLGFNFNRNKCERGKQNGICPALWTGSIDENGLATRSTSYDAFLERLVGGNKVDLVTFHQVEKLVFDNVDLTKVIGVKAINTRSMFSTEFRARKEVILSSGTYNTPQILMLSGIGPAQALQQLNIPVVVDSPGVAQNLRDHYCTFTTWNRVTLAEDSPFLFQSPVFNFFGPETNTQTKYQFQISGTFGSVLHFRAQSVGEVRVLSTDPMVPVEIDPNVVSTPADLQALVDGLKDFILPFFGDLVNKGILSVGSLDPASTEQEIRDYILNGNILSSHHAVGTCKVGPDSDPMAVVDSDFKVRGATNLRVVDASVFPVVPSSNTNSPTMSIALLASEKLMGGDFYNAINGVNETETSGRRHLRRA